MLIGYICDIIIIFMLKRGCGLLQAFVLTALMVVMCCCSSDDARLLTANELGGDLAADQVVMTLNGKQVDSRAMISVPSGIAGDSMATDHEMTIMLDRILLPKVKSVGKVCNVVTYVPEINVTLRGDENGMALSGSYKMQGMDINICGMLENPTDPGHRTLKVDVVYDASSFKYVGKTFEIEFNDGSLCADFMSGPQGTKHIAGDDMTLRQCINWFQSRANKALREGSGYDGARITFNVDGSMDVSLRDKTSKQYVAQEYKFRYMTDRNFLFTYAPTEFMSVLERSRKVSEDLWGAKGNVYSEWSNDQGELTASCYVLSNETNNQPVLEFPSGRCYLKNWSADAGYLTYPHNPGYEFKPTEEWKAFDWIGQCVDKGINPG